jgi:hypothetical protein
MTPAKASFTPSLTRAPRLENGLGHEDQFLPLRLSARSVIRKQTVAATRGNGQDAPIAAVPGAGMERAVRPKSALRGPAGGWS